MEEMPELDDETIQALISLGVIPDQQADIKDRIKKAYAAKTADGPQMRKAGNVVVSASPLEFLGSYLEKGKAAGDMNRLRGENSFLQDKQVAGRTRFFKALMQQKQLGQQGDDYRNDPYSQYGD